MTYEYFAVRRFAVDVKDLDKLAELIALFGAESNVDINKLKRELTVVEEST